MSSSSSNLSEYSKENAILHNLNSRQAEAVTALTGATLVIAGAGSGKTSVLTRRVANFINQGVTPGSILCVTFTNKAAAEMNHRVQKLLASVGINLPFAPAWKPDYTQSPLLCTFHSLGVRILREFGEFVGLKPEFSILDTDDQTAIVRRILKELNVDIKNLQPKLALYFISQCKQEMLDSSHSRQLSKEYLPIFHQIYRKYEEELQASQVVDFDDLLLLTHTLLSQHETVRSQLHKRWSHVMVDEFQDTNQIQFEIIRLLMPPNRLHNSSTPTHFDAQTSTSLFVVGDDAQSIYAFRGSKIGIILNFTKEYPSALEIVLNQNYRSTQPILDLAEKILTHNPHQKKKELFTENPEKIDVHYYLARNERDEVEFIVRTLHRLFAESAGKSTISATSANDENPASRLVIPNFEAKSDIHLDQSESDQTNISSYDDGEIDLDISESHTSFDNPVSSGVSSMFDVYLESEDFSPYQQTAQKSGFNGFSQFSQANNMGGYQPSSWQVPEYKWDTMKELNDVVVLYRTHAQSRIVEETFLKYHVPYRLVSGTRFLDRREIKDVMAMLKYLSNGDDKVSLHRFLPVLLDGVGPKTMEKIMAYLEDFEYPLPPRFAQQVLELFNKLQSVWLNNTNLIDLTKELVTVSGYTRYLKEEFPSKEEFETRMENIGELYSLMFAFDQDKTVELPVRLSAFLEHVGLMTQQEANEGDINTPKISLMSLHQSKGLEFETVFLIGCEDGILPHQNSFMEEKGMEEEVRLAYVGVTRAKRHLYLTSADSRVSFGQIKANPVSRIIRPFLDGVIKRVGR